MASPEASAAPPRLLVPVLVVGLLTGVFVLLAWPTTGAGDGGTHADRRSVATSGPTAGPTAGSTAGSTSAPTSRLEVEAAAVLRAWDRRRAEAWAAGDAASLSSLYVTGASARRADVAMLADWTARGLAVDRLTTQLLAVRVLAHDPGRWRLRVRDRVTAAVASGSGLAQPLPAGGVTERMVVLRRVGADWRVASVRQVGARVSARQPAPLTRRGRGTRIPRP